MRLDQALVQRNLVATRARARDLVLRGHVTIAGRVANKPSVGVDDAAEIAVVGAAATYVSRGAEKLIGGLDHFGFDVMGRTCIDVGASTGGFTQVLIERGAAKVYAVDVGRGQLHERLRQDGRVLSMEETDARLIDRVRVPDPVDAVVTDLSFISLSKALGPALALAVPGAWLIALVKPQFEVGRDHVGKGGIVRDEARRRKAVDDVADWLRGADWLVQGVVPSPIFGGDGNEEFLLGATKVGAVTS